MGWREESQRGRGEIRLPALLLTNPPHRLGLSPQLSPEMIA